MGQKVTLRLTMTIVQLGAREFEYASLAHYSGDATALGMGRLVANNLEQAQRAVENCYGVPKGDWYFGTFGWISHYEMLLN